jgi:PTS system glucose-specific IIC component
LIPFGLHHIWNAPFFFEVGSYVDPATGNTIRGEIYRFTSGDPTAGNLAGGYLFKMWGLPAAALAMWQTARPENRAKVGGIMISAAMTSFLTGITEPIEFSFLFVAPLLYVIHAVLAGAAYVIAVLLGIHHSTTFSHGLIDFVVLYPNAQRGWWLLWLGPLYALLYYVIFRSVIVARDYKTPGREVETAATERATGGSASTSSMGERLLAAFGGAGNIKSLDACITRLRIELHDPAKASEPSLRELGATGVLKTAGGVQAIFGTRSEQLKHEMAAAMQGGAAVQAAVVHGAVARGADAPAPAPRAEVSVADAPAAAALLAALGGSANVAGADAVAHTRLRLTLADPSRLDEPALAALGARAVQRLDGNIVHIIVGPAAAAWAARLASTR